MILIGFDSMAGQATGTTKHVCPLVPGPSEEEEPLFFQPGQRP